MSQFTKCLMHVRQTPEKNPILLWFWMLDVAVEQKEASPWLILGYSSVLSAFKTSSLLSKCSFLCPFLKFSSIIWPVQLMVKRTPRHFSEFISVSLHWMFSGKGEGLYLQQSSTNFSQHWSGDGTSGTSSQTPFQYWKQREYRWTQCSF